MAKKIDLNQNLNKKSDTFIEKTNSEMHYKSEISSDIMDFEWVTEIELACPYIDNVVRNPKLTLIREEETVKIEKTKKISVASVKDLARHTHYIEKIDKVTNDIQPKKLLIERVEETFNIYENRFLFTLIYNLTRFVMAREKELDDIIIKDERTLEYAATTITGMERVNIEIKMTANEMPGADTDDSLQRKIEKEIEEVRKRIRRINAFLASWKSSELYTTLENAHVAHVIPPIKKTNIILKNPNFQVAYKLWAYLRAFEDEKPESERDGLDTDGSNLLKGILDDAFLMDFIVMDSISSSKKEQKQRLAEYAVVMMHQQIKRVMEMLLTSGISITDEEILNMIAEALKKERNKVVIDSVDVKNKFKNAFDEYLEKARNYL